MNNMFSRDSRNRKNLPINIKTVNKQYVIREPSSNNIQLSNRSPCAMSRSKLDSDRSSVVSSAYVLNSRSLGAE